VAVGIYKKISQNLEVSILCRKFARRNQIRSNMATITLSSAVYNDAKQYAETQNLTVDEFIVSLINKFALSRQGKKKYKIQPIEKLSPEIRDILSMPIIGQLDADDINCDKARMEYYKEKYGL
jgi:hypothetical protein